MILNKIINSSLDFEESKALFRDVFTDMSPIKISAILTALAVRGETIDEIAGAAYVLREKSMKISSPANAIDNCGTGGDSSNSLNISTAVAFIVSGCGVAVAKHGNISVSSKSGSANVLSELGVNIENFQIMEKALSEIGICFLFAQKFHSIMKNIAPIRKELAIRTIFNILGPLSNPANVENQIIGVYSEDLLEKIANVLKKLGSKNVWVVHGDGLDEITTTGITKVARLQNGEIDFFEINPSDYGLSIASKKDFEGKDASYNAIQMKELLLGKGNKYYEDIVLINSAACLMIANKVTNLKEGIELAKEAIKNGQAMNKLNQLIEYSNA